MGSSLSEPPAHGIAGAKSPAGADSTGATAGEGVAPRRGALGWLQWLLQRSRPRPGWPWARALYRVVLAGVGLTALAAGVRLPLADFYRAIGAYDEGVLLTNAHLLLRGELPYRDFYTNYPPGIFALIAGCFAVFGQSVAVERCLGLGLHLAVAALAGRVAGRALGERFSFVVCGMVASWLALLGLPAYAWLAGLSLALLVCELWVWAQERGRPRDHVLVGVSLGLVSWFRHDLFIYFSSVLGGFGVAWIAANWWRGQRGAFFSRGSPLQASPLHGVFHVAGGALVVLLLLWGPVFAAAGISRVTHDIYFDQVRYTLAARVLPLPSLTALGRPSWSPVALPAFLLAPFPGAVLLTLVGPVLGVGALLWPRAAGLRSYRSMVGPAALTIAVIPQTMGRTDVWHSVFAVTPALLACAVWLIGGPERRWNAARSWGLLLPGVVALYMPLRDSFAVQKKELKPQTFRAELSRAGRTPVAGEWRRALAFVSQHTGKDDPLYVGLTDHRWTHKNDMALYFLADRVGATRYMQFDPGLNNREDVQRSMIDELEQTRPKVALLAAAKRPTEPNRSRDPGSTLLDGYMRTHYEQRGRAGSLRLMLRRPVSVAPARATAAPSPATAPSVSSGAATP
jgi:hypothetical protein